MPELPEVEVMRRNLVRLAGSRPLVGVDVLDAAVVAPAGAPIAGLIGHPVVAGRRGKHLICAFGPYALVVHMRMTGQLVEDRGQRGRLRLRFEKLVGYWFKAYKTLNGLIPGNNQFIQLSSRLSKFLFPVKKPAIFLMDFPDFIN